MELQVSLGLLQGSRQAIQRYNCNYVIGIGRLVHFYIMQEQANAETSFYEVEEVLDRKLIQGKVYYLIKWRNYSEAEATWEYARRLPYIKPLIRKFNSKNKPDKDRSCSSRNISTIISEEDSSNTLWGDSDKQKHTHPPSRPTVPPTPQKHKKQSSNITWRLTDDAEGKISGNERSWKEKRGWQTKSKPNLMPNIEESLIHHESDKIDLNLPITEEHSVDNTSSRKTFKPVSILRYDSLQKSKANKDQDQQPLGQQQEPKVIQPHPQGQAQTHTQKIQVQAQASIQKPVQAQQPVVVQAQQQQAQAQVHGRRGAGVKKIRFAVKEDKSGVEYFLQEQDGKLSLVDGDQLLEKYPKELLAYLEGLLVRHEAK